MVGWSIGYVIVGGYIQKQDEQQMQTWFMGLSFKCVSLIQPRINDKIPVSRKSQTAVQMLTETLLHNNKKPHCKANISRYRSILAWTASIAQSNVIFL